MRASIVALEDFQLHGVLLASIATIRLPDGGRRVKNPRRLHILPWMVPVLGSHLLDLEVALAVVGLALLVLELLIIIFQAAWFDGAITTINDGVTDPA